MKSLDYFNDMYNRMRKDYIHACKIGDTKTSAQLLNDVQYVVEAIALLRKNASSLRNHVIGWDELKYQRRKPVYIEVVNKDGLKWSGWWDILDKVTADRIKTAYGEEFPKETKGKEWQVYDTHID